MPGIFMTSETRVILFGDGPHPASKGAGMTVQKPTGSSLQTPVKQATQTSAKASAATPGSQGHKGHHFGAYMSADGRPKQAFHPYRDMRQPASSTNTALLAKYGIVRPLAMASLPPGANKRTTDK